MKILAAGGGSGGHVTPVLAVIYELKRSDPALEAEFICDNGFRAQAERILAKAPVSMDISTIRAGKLRRYHGIPLWRQLLDIQTVLLNLRDSFLLFVGFLQSLAHMRRSRPDVVFTKGGFVCVPVGLAAACLGIPLVIHDSDAHPGLTNRILARYATAIATGAPLENYQYPAEKSHYTGTPVDAAYRPVSASQRRSLKEDLGYDPGMPLLLVTGGGLGAQRINEALLHNLDVLTRRAQIVHLTGTGNIDVIKSHTEGARRYVPLAFVDKEMPALMRAADIVVTRAGATTLLEVAASAAVCVIVPNPRLTSGHQLKNAHVYEKAGAATILDEASLDSHPSLLGDTILELLDSPEKMSEYRRAIVQLARTSAAADVAKLIMAAVPREEAQT